jgi:hypothetical protein
MTPHKSTVPIYWAPNPSHELLWRVVQDRYNQQDCWRAGDDPAFAKALKEFIAVTEGGRQ